LFDFNRPFYFAITFVLACSACAVAQQPATSRTFVLHKFAKAIGKEAYSIETKGDGYTLTSHFLFTDRGSPVPLETTFVAQTADMSPRSYVAKGRASRQSEMDDALTVNGNDLTIMRRGKTETHTANGPWFITDGYSPVAMQEQMMRWWLMHGRPSEFTVYPSNSKVHIEPAGSLSVNGRVGYGYTVGGLIWGEESLWMDNEQNLIALVSTDAEFDHFEAVREPYEASLSAFIAAAVQADLAALAKLSAATRMAPAPILAIVGHGAVDRQRYGDPEIPSWGWESQLQGGSCRTCRPWAQCFDCIVAHSDGVAGDGATGHNDVSRSQRGPKHLLIDGDSAGQRKYFADGQGLVCGCKQWECSAGDGGVDE
jgi:hypothetical protein